MTDEADRFRRAMPKLPVGLALAAQAIDMLRRGGRLLSCPGMALCVAVHTSDRTWLGSVDRVTLTQLSSGAWRTRYWADQTELTAPSDLSELRLANTHREHILREGSRRAPEY